MWELLVSALQSKLVWSTALIFGIYLYFKLVIFKYWKRHGVPYEPPSIPFGNTLPVALGKMCTGELLRRSYERFKSYPFHGMYMFHRPHLVINDPDLIRLILVKDFPYFHDRGLYYNNDVDPLSGHLFFMPGEEWKYLRSKLSPTFTSGKIKQMFPLVENVGENLENTLRICVEKSNIVEIKDLLSRYTTDMIASIAFGVECNSLKNPKTEFRENGKKILDVPPIKVLFTFFFSKVLDILRIPFMSKDGTKFFSKVFREIITQRRTNRVLRKDFLNLLIQLMETGEIVEDEKTVPNSSISHSNTDNLKRNDTLGMSEACAQALVFFVAGFETSSSTTTYCLYELALNIEIQDKLREEIKMTLGENNKVTYEDVHAMSYLDKVVSETLRKYPILPILNRVCLKDYYIPNSDFCIKKGMNVIIPILGLQRDEKIFDNPEEFRPERFDSDQVAKRHAFTNLPFGEGPRICIGKRFGLLQVKVALIKILSHYKVTVSEKTEIPLNQTKRNLLFMPESEVFLRVDKV